MILEEKKVIFENDIFDENDICFCEVSYLDKKNIPVLIKEHVYSKLRNYTDKITRQQKGMKKKEYSSIETIKIKFIKAIGSKI